MAVTTLWVSPRSSHPASIARSRHDTGASCSTIHVCMPDCSVPFVDRLQLAAYRETEAPLIQLKELKQCST
jgi:hypothetical protein